MKRMESNARTFLADAKIAAKQSVALRRRAQQQMRDAVRLEAACDRLLRYARRIGLIGLNDSGPISARLKRHLRSRPRRT